MIKFIFCKVLGWKIIGETNPVKKCVMIVAPHTHWLDFFVAIPVRRILNLFIGLNITVFLIIAATIIFDTFANLAFLSYILIISYLFFYFQKLEPLN